jgi:hypothetical protein
MKTDAELTKVNFSECFAQQLHLLAKTSMEPFFRCFSFFWSFFGHLLLAFHRFTGFLPILDTPRPGS